MGEPIDPDQLQSTTHRELIPYVIEHRSSCRQTLSCDLNGVLTLRGIERSGPEGLPP